MSRRSTVLVLAALVATSCAVAHLVLAAGPTGVPEQLQPGTKCRLTADIECEIQEVRDDAVLVTLTTVVEASSEQGVPMMSKVPYVNRMFKNVGKGRDVVQTTLTIPRDQIQAITPLEP